jgi:divalent anion:Na+ symporter, DASS family
VITSDTTAPPQLKETAHVQTFAQGKLAALAPMTRRERILLAILAAVIVGWISSPWHGLGNTIVAMADVCAILLSGALPLEPIFAQDFDQPLNGRDS